MLLSLSTERCPSLLSFPSRDNLGQQQRKDRSERGAVAANRTGGVPGNRVAQMFSSAWLWGGLTVLLTASIAEAGGGIYGYTDADGILHLSNVPQQPAYCLLLADQYGKPPPATRSSTVGHRSLFRGQNLPFADDVGKAATTFGLDPSLLQAIIFVESNHNPAAVSPKGAMGLMQLMPATTRRFEVADPWRPADNVRGGAQYLSSLLATFDNDLALALAAYNAGEQAVIRHGRRVPPYTETRQYVDRVLGVYQMLQQY